MARIGIVIVTHNSEAEISECLNAALRSGCDVLVVDNASSDRTCEQVRRHGGRLISNAVNRGFAAAMNQGAGALENSLILALNPDCVLQTGLEPLRRTCERPGVGGAGGMLVDAAGQPQRGFMVRRFPGPIALVFECLLVNRLWPGNPVNWQYRCMDLSVSEPSEVQQPAGAFLLFRRDVWQALGGFDEGFYPLWFEDVDFCKRARDAGYTFDYVPDVVAKHTGGHSLRSLGVEKRALYWYGGLLRYSAKHLRPGSVRVIALAVVTGSFLRILAGVFLGRGRLPIAAYGGVVHLACRFLFSRHPANTEVLSTGSMMHGRKSNH